MRNLVKTSINGLSRDMGSGAIINTNDIEYQMFKDQRKRSQEQADLTHEVNMMKSELREIKSLLLQVLGNK